MYQCELFSIQKNTADAQALKAAQEQVKSSLATDGIEVKNVTELGADPKKLDSAVSKMLSSGNRDYFVFTNALDSDDPSSFRGLFYRVVDNIESGIQLDEAHKDYKPKLKVLSLGDLGKGFKGYCFSIGGKRFVALPQASLTGKDNAELVREGVRAAEDKFKITSETYPEGIVYYDPKGNEADPSLNRGSVSGKVAPKQKQGFFKSFIPLKTDSKKQKARKITVLVAMVAFIVALIYVLEFYIFGPMRNNAVTSEIQTIAYNKDADDKKDDGPAQDWDALKEINDEIVGWVTIPDTVIDYPVLFHEGDDRYNQYYIDKSYKKDGTEYGSIFLDYRSTDSVNSRNVIMHGHNMRDGSQFHSLLSYSHEGDLKGDLDYYRKHPVIIFNTPEGDAKYKIISVFKTSTRYEHGEFFNYMQGAFNSDAEFMNFVYNLRIRSMFDIPVTCNEGDQIITLSTCCYEFYEWRCVVVARKVRPGEDESVDVNLASLNPSPLFPDVYYERYGGERPDPLTFKTANSKSAISWYDGKGDLEGSEDLTATLAANPTEPPTEKPKPGETRPTEPPEITYYQVVYRNVDGSQYAAYNVREGDPLPTPPGTPTMAEDDNFTYVFDGWNLDIPGVDFQHLNVGLEIYPTFNAIPK